MNGFLEIIYYNNKTFWRLGNYLISATMLGPDMARKQVYRKYDVILIMMFNGKERFWKVSNFKQAFSEG